MNNATISLRTPVQVAIFPEVQAELSDGHWKGSLPRGNGKAWGGIRAVVDPKRLGRSFEPPKVDYDLLNKDAVKRMTKRISRRVKAETGEALSQREIRRELRDIM